MSEDKVYEESYLFMLWVLRDVPYPRNSTLQVNVGTYGYRATLASLTEEERLVWEMERAQARAALGTRFVAEM